MRKPQCYWVLVCALFVFASNDQTARAAILGTDAILGIEWDTGKLYSISTSTAAMTLIGNTGVSYFDDLAFSPGGTLYAFTNIAVSSGAPAALYTINYTINPSTAVPTFIGNLGASVIEGGLAFSPEGVAYGTNSGSTSSPGLFTINLATGALTNVGTISGGSHDINGLAWRSDRKLVGLDRVTSSLIAIDPVTAEITPIAAVPAAIGSVGGMTVQGGMGYFATGGPGVGIPGTIPGSSELYSFNLFTGETHLIGSFSPAITGAGISGLAAPVPEPAALALFALGSGLLFKRKRSLSELGEKFSQPPIPCERCIGSGQAGLFSIG